MLNIPKSWKMILKKLQFGHCQCKLSLLLHDSLCWFYTNEPCHSRRLFQKAKSPTVLVATTSLHVQTFRCLIFPWTFRKVHGVK